MAAASHSLLVETRPPPQEPLSIMYDHEDGGGDGSDGGEVDLQMHL